MTERTLKPGTTHAGPKPLTEERVREIIREEMANAGMEMVPESVRLELANMWRTIHRVAN